MKGAQLGPTWGVGPRGPRAPSLSHETRPRGPETRPVGSQGDPKHAKTLACHGGAPIEWREGPKSPNSRVFGKGKGAGKGAGKWRVSGGSRRVRVKGDRSPPTLALALCALLLPLLETP